MSEEKILFKNKWVSLIEKTNPDSGDKYTIFKESDKVMVLPYFISNGKLYVIYLLEPINIWRNNKAELTCISGTIEPNENHFDTAIRELAEESGIVQEDKSKWEFLDSMFHSKSATSQRFLYLVDISDSDIVRKSTDGSWFEKNTKNVVSEISTEMKKLSKDIYFHFMINYLETKQLSYEKK
jgi:hypothetical protein